MYTIYSIFSYRKLLINIQSFTIALQLREPLHIYSTRAAISFKITLVKHFTAAMFPVCSGCTTRIQTLYQAKPNEQLTLIIYVVVTT